MKTRELRTEEVVKTRKRECVKPRKETNQSLVTGVLPKSWKTKMEAVDQKYAGSITAAFRNLDVAATLEAFARGQRAPEFGQHALTVFATQRLSGAPDVSTRALRALSRKANENPPKAEFIPPFPPLTAFGASFFRSGVLGCGNGSVRPNQTESD
jgi:hypothetical protein